MKRTILSIIIMLLTVVGASAQSMIARGEVGTCIWYITSDGELVIAPQAGTTMGDLPEDGWNDVDGTPWMPYAENITSARFEPGVDAISLDCMFYNLYNLKDVDFTNFDTKNVMKMSKTFSGCSSLEYLDLSKLNTENVKWMYRMIHNCSNLKTLNLTNFQTQYAYDLDDLFQNCDSLFTIISDNEEPSLLRYNTFNYFGNCSKATLKVPYGSRMKYMQSDGWRSLGNISDGTEPTFPADVLAKGEVNTCLWYITADSTLVIAPTDGVSGDLPADGWGGSGYNRVYAPWSDYGGTVKAIVVEDGVNAISCRSMFMEMYAAESADLRGLNTENATDLSYMFLKSSKLKTIDISSLKTDNVENMESMFDGCYQLESIDVSGFNTKNVLSMNGMFSRCESLTTLDLSSFDVSNVTDMNSMFYYCLNLKTLDITNFTASEETATGWLFSSCDSLSTIISKSKTPTALKSGFFESYDNRADCTLLVPTGSKDLYAAADGWNELGNIEEKDFPTNAPVIPADAIASGEEGTCIWYITSEGELVIAPADGVSGTLPKYAYRNYAPWSSDSYIDMITSAKIIEGVTPTYGDYLFYSLKKMKSIDLSNLNTQNVTNMLRMFSGCSSLTSLDLSNFNTQNVTSMSYMFGGCYSLTSLDLSNFNTQNVTSMEGMFSDCSSLTSLDLSNFNTQNVTNMEHMFFCCYFLTSLDLSNFNTQNVTNMSWMFAGCSSLTSLDLSNINTQNVTNMFWMFHGCSSLTSLDLSNFNTQNVTSMSSMFSGCDSLKYIISNLDNPSILQTETFNSLTNRANCTLLVPAGTKDLYAAADGWNELGNIEEKDFPTNAPVIPADAIASGEEGTCIWYITSEGELVIAPADGVSGDLPEEGWTMATSTYMTSAPWGAHSKEIKSAKIMPGVKATSCNSMFFGLNHMETADLSGLDTQDATNLSSMFYECSSLKSVNLSNMDTHNVTNMNGMFYECKSLMSLDLSNFNTQNVTNMSSMFATCSSLTSLDLSSFDTHNVKDMSYMFMYSGLIHLNLTNFDTQNVTNMNYMFDGCDNLKYITSNLEEPSTLKMETFYSFDNREDCTLNVPEGSKSLYEVADGWSVLGIIEEMYDPARPIFGQIWASVSPDDYIGVHDLELLQLAYPDNKAGKEGYENYEMRGMNWDAIVTLLDRDGAKIEEAYAHEVDSIATLEFSAKLKRGEEYTVNVPKGLYLIYNIEDFTSVESPAETLTYITNHIMGDVNGDKQHSVTDVVGLASYILKGSDEVGMLVVDINGDEEATVTDITMLVDKIMTGMFPWEAEMARPRSFTTPIQAPRLFLDNKDNALALSFDNSNEFCSMQFDVTLTDADGNDITSAKSIKVKVGDGTQGHSVTTGIVDGKLRVLVYSLGNKSFKAGDVVSISIDGHDTYTASITNTELTTTSFAAVRPEGVEANVSIANGINEISSSANAQVYDLTGRKLNATTKQGVIIVGGKKVSTVQIGK